MAQKRILFLALPWLMMLVPTLSQAGCGAAFCSLHTQWEIQGAWMEPGTRIGLRYEYIDQDQPRSGTDKVAVGSISQHHDEVRTLNRNGLLTLDHAFDPYWGLSVTLPLLDRRHSHIHNHHGEQLFERWNYSRTGDLRILVRHQPHAGAGGMVFGLKLPTGKTDLVNAEGATAERTLQPGSGTTDILLGGFYQHRPLNSSISLFTQLLWQSAAGEQDAFKPGDQISLDAGIRHDSGSNLHWMLQLNLLDKASDEGNAAEPANSGGRFAHISPGLSIGISESFQFYAFIQHALYQNVRGVQLTAEQSFVAGISSHF